MPRRWDASSMTSTSTCFQAAGLILLVAMIGAIVLTLRQREGVKRQNVLKQIYRDREVESR